MNLSLIFLFAGALVSLIAYKIGYKSGHKSGYSKASRDWYDLGFKKGNDFDAGYDLGYKNGVARMSPPFLLQDKGPWEGK